MPPEELLLASACCCTASTTLYLRRRCHAASAQHRRPERPRSGTQAPATWALKLFSRPLDSGAAATNPTLLRARMFILVPCHHPYHLSYATLASTLVIEICYNFLKLEARYSIYIPNLPWFVPRQMKSEIQTQTYACLDARHQVFQQLHGLLRRGAANHAGWGWRIRTQPDERGTQAQGEAVHGSDCRLCLQLKRLRCPQLCSGSLKHLLVVGNGGLGSPQFSLVASSSSSLLLSFSVSSWTCCSRSEVRKPKATDARIC